MRPLARLTVVLAVAIALTGCLGPQLEVRSRMTARHRSSSN